MLFPVPCFSSQHTTLLAAYLTLQFLWKP